MKMTMIFQGEASALRINGHRIGHQVGHLIGHQIGQGPDPVIIHLNQGHGQGQAQGQGQGAPKSMVRTIGYFLNLGTRDHISPRR